MSGFLISCNLNTRHSYNMVAQRYHDMFSDEIIGKIYDRNLLDIFAKRFGRGSWICDAGCGPSAHIGRYLFDKGMNVTGVDISDRCIAMARELNPGMQFLCDDIAGLACEQECFDGIVSYYSIIHTPKALMGTLFDEFYRMLKPGGSLLVAVKAGFEEGFQKELLGVKTEIYFSYFSEAEIRKYFEASGFCIDLIDKRSPYDSELRRERIFAIGKKPLTN